MQFNGSDKVNLDCYGNKTIIMRSFINVLIYLFQTDTVKSSIFSHPKTPFWCLESGHSVPFALPAAWPAMKDATLLEPV